MLVQLLSFFSSFSVTLLDGQLELALMMSVLELADAVPENWFEKSGVKLQYWTEGREPTFGSRYREANGN